MSTAAGAQQGFGLNDAFVAYFLDDVARLRIATATGLDPLLVLSLPDSETTGFTAERAGRLAAWEAATEQAKATTRPSWFRRDLRELVTRTAQALSVGDLLERATGDAIVAGWRSAGVIVVWPTRPNDASLRSLDFGPMSEHVQSWFSALAGMDDAMLWRLEQETGSATSIAFGRFLERGHALASAHDRQLGWHEAACRVRSLVARHGDGSAWEGNHGEFLIYARNAAIMAAHVAKALVIADLLEAGEFEWVTRHWPSFGPPVPDPYRTSESPLPVVRGE